MHRKKCLTRIPGSPLLFTPLAHAQPRTRRRAQSARLLHRSAHKTNTYPPIKRRSGALNFLPSGPVPRERSNFASCAQQPRAKESDLNCLICPLMTRLICSCSSHTCLGNKPAVNGGRCWAAFAHEVKSLSAYFHCLFSLCQ